MGLVELGPYERWVVAKAGRQGRAEVLRRRKLAGGVLALGAVALLESEVMGVRWMWRWKG